MGLIQIYCGDGKGKTTASVGLCVRAAGRRIPVVFAQFLKGDSSGEIGILRQLPGVTVMHAPDHFGFTRTMTEEQKCRAKEEYEELFRNACEKAAELAGETEEAEANPEKAACLLVLDEAAAACGCGLLDPGAVTKWLKEKPALLEVVLTGRNPNPEWIRLSDYVSEIGMKKHPYERGVPARRGIEY